VFIYIIKSVLLLKYYKPAGISSDQIWIQRSPLGSGAPDLEVISIETHDPANMFKEFATSNHPWAIEFCEFATKSFGIDFSGPLPPLNENIYCDIRCRI
jgi:hypothetical protein